MNENNLNELIQKLVVKLQKSHSENIERGLHFSESGKDFMVLADWKDECPLDLPDTVRIVCFNTEDGPGYMCHIRFDVGENDGNQVAKFTLTEGEYNLSEDGKKEELLKLALEDIF